MAGWIKLHRQIVDSDIYVMPPLYLRVFERLLLEANHQDKTIPFKYSGDAVTTTKLIRRGERQTSIRQICEWVGWYENGVFRKPNPKTIKEILAWLEHNNMIEIYPRQSNKDGTHYRIVNYDLYQNTDEPEVTVQKQSGNNWETVTGAKQERLRMNKNDNYISSSQNAPTFAEDSPEFQLAIRLRERILANLPDARVPRPTPEGMSSWCKQMDYILRLDKRAPEDVARVIDWCQSDSFWRANIMSPKKLREKWETLVLQMERGRIYLASRKEQADDPYAVYNRF